MFKGDWLRHPAIGVALFALIGLGYSALLPEPAGADRAPKCSEDQLRDPGSRCFIPDLALAYPQPFSDEWRAQKDLEAQQAMAFWAGAMFFITAAGVWYVALTLDATRATVRVANRATEETQKIATAQMRPYVHIESIRVTKVTESIERVSGKPTWCAVIEFLLKNTGNTPARNVCLAFAADQRIEGGVIVKKDATAARRLLIGARSSTKVNFSLFFQRVMAGQLWKLGLAQAPEDAIGKGSYDPSVFLDGTLSYTDHECRRRFIFWWSYRMHPRFAWSGYLSPEFESLGEDTSRFQYSRISEEREISLDQDR